MIGPLLADIASGEADLADVVFLVALVLFGVVSAARAIARDIFGALGAAGAAALSLAWLVL
jgi:hypothetical protein